jgi:outer membrane biosynthesis protein TonB
MKQKLTILILLSLLALAGCNNSGTDKARELELKEKELALKEKELELTQKNPKANDSTKTEKSEKPEKTETPKPVKKVEPPSGATVATINASDVVARSQPSLTAKKIALLKKGQKVFVIGVSDDLVVWEGEYYTMKNVQLENGQKGWVLNRFIDEN